MAKAVADVVLVNGDFAAVPGMVAEGRRILRNIQRVTKLFVTKSVFAAFLIVAIGITPADYPLLPRHLTIVGTLTVGIPAFFLALAPSEGSWRTDGFLREVGTVCGARRCRRRARGDDHLSDRAQRLRPRPAPVADGRHVDAGDRRPLPRARARGDEHAAGAARRASSAAALFAVYVAILALPGLRRFFELAVPNPAALVLDRRSGPGSRSGSSGSPTTGSFHSRAGLG